MIIFAQINYTQDHSEKILPLGILSVGSALKTGGFQVELVNFTEREILETARYIVSKNPEFLGLSVMTGSQTLHSAQLSQEIKKLNPDLPILWGGIHPSLVPQQCLTEDYVDFVIVGEGEETVNEFANALRSKTGFEGILGLGYKKNGAPVVNPRRPLLEDLDKWRLDFSLLDLEKYIYKLGPYQRTIAYKTSRGCPFGCGFCYNHEFNKSRYRTWSVKSVIEDIEFLKREYKIDAIKFYDDNFFVNKDRALEILQRINLPSHIEIRIDFITDELAESLKKLKVFDLLIGLESGSDRLLKLIDKNFTRERAIKGVKSLAKHDLHPTYSFIVGLPTETKEEFDSTVDFMYEIYKIHPKAAFTLGAYLPYPGSKLYEFSQEQGFCPPKNTEDWGKIDRFRSNFRSPWVDTKKVWIIRECFKIMGWDWDLLKKWFEFRIRHKIYFFSFDIHAVEFLAGVAIEEKGFLGKTMRQAYNFIRFRQ